MINELLGHMRERNLADFSKIPVGPGALSDLLDLVQANSVSGRTALINIVLALINVALNAKKVITSMFEGDDRSPLAIIKANNWEILQAEKDELVDLCRTIVERFPNEVLFVAFR